MSYAHTVFMDERRCLGCTSCIKSCPTDAIRVRNGKALILQERCIDCGKCIRSCPHKAIRSTGDDFALLKNFDYCVALPDPALYAQFQNLEDINIVLNALLQIGFDKVYEVSRAAELLTDYSRQELKRRDDELGPVISACCPTVLHLIRTRFPHLIAYLSGHLLPMELGAILARREASVETGIAPERIGIFALVPCSSKAMATHNPQGLETPVIDGAFATRDIYLKLLAPMRAVTAEDAPPLKRLLSSGSSGLGYAISGGESSVRRGDRCIVVDGIDNVIEVLSSIEDDRISEATFIELNACTQGCVGGCYNVENPYIARMHMVELQRDLPLSCNRYLFQGEDRHLAHMETQISYSPAFLLDTDRTQAMLKQRKIQDLERTLPGLHCGACGAPSCHAFAEDVVLERAEEDDCIFKMRAKMQHIQGFGSADQYLPPPFRKRNQAGK